MRREGCLLGETRDLVRPDVFGADRVVRVAFQQEVLEEAHVLEAEQRGLVLWLLGDQFRPRLLCRGKQDRTWCTILGSEGYSHLRPCLTQCPHAGFVSWHYCGVLISLGISFSLSRTTYLDPPPLAVETSPPALRVAASF
jgi:hypothetical protein